MTWPLAGSLAGLAALDSLNPATLVAVTLILLSSRRRPVAEALGFVLGAFVTVMVVGAAVYLGADAAAASVTSGLTWLRRAAFGFAALVLFLASVRSLRVRHRKAIGLPAWFTPLTAGGLGVLMTGADLPNAFPYFIAIERMVSAELGTTTALLVLAAYAVVYCLPCLVLLALGLSHGDRVTAWLRRLHDRFGSEATIAPSWKRATLLFVASLLVGAVALAA